MLCPGPRELALERVLDDIRSGLFGLESITLKRVVQRGRSRCRLVISVARGETRLESDVALFLTPDLTGVGT